MTSRRPARSAPGPTKSRVMPSSQAAPYQRRASARWSSSAAGCAGCDCAHQDGQENSIAASVPTRAPATPPRAAGAGQLRAQCRHLRPDGAVVADHRRVPLLRAGRRLPPLEVQHRVGAAGHRLQRPEPVLPRPLRDVALAPVDAGRGLLHQQPRPAVAEPAHEVGDHRRVHVGARIGRVLVGVLGDHVQVRRPGPVVHRRPEADEVRRDRPVGVPAQHLPLGQILVEQLVRAEPAPVEPLPRVGEGRGGPRRQHLGPVRVALRPEAGAPGGIEPVEVAVPAGQPVPEPLRAAVAEALPHVVARLVADVPEHHGRMPAEPFGDPLDQLQRPLPVGHRGRAERLPAARPQPGAVGQLRQRGRVEPRHPRWRRRGRGGQVDRDAAAVQQLDHPLQPAEVVLAGTRLEPGPGEHPDGHQRDAGRAHELDVLGPDLRRPLLRVVVAAEPDGAGAAG